MDRGLAQSSMPLDTPGTPDTTRMSLAAIRDWVADDLKALDDCIKASLNSDVALINDMGRYILEAGGKRVRPMLTLLAGRALNCHDGAHIKLAAVVELIHTATLLHDDVVDASALRRGRRTANDVWGNQAPVLVGDYIYSRCFQLMVETGRLEVLDIMAKATNAIAEGEVLQLLQCHNSDTDEAAYFAVIERKTARLFEAAARLGAVTAGATIAQQNALGDFGLKLGLAYQLIDDVIDYSGSASESGKNPGDDLAEGKMTLPLIKALQGCGIGERETLARIVREGDVGGLPTVRSAIESTGAIAYTAALAKGYASDAASALEGMPTSAHVSALRRLAVLAVERSA